MTAPMFIPSFSCDDSLTLRNALVAGSVARLVAELERLGVKRSTEPSRFFGDIKIIECAALELNKVYFVDANGNVVREWTLPDGGGEESA